ncbi:MAG TPA: hypothetical protein VL495_09695 [Edaphobacter sp.]|nr:hypothetical protein [Edaphobacter sp.]
MRRGVRAPLRSLLLSGCFALALSGCSRLRPKPPAEYIYVTAKQTYLRDRVAAVSNRTATVENGEKLKVLEKSRRFFRVETPKGEQGWIDDRAVVTQEIFDQFAALDHEHANDPVIATAVVRDDVYLHTKPGRETDRLFRLQEGDKLKLYRRASVEKPVAPGQQVLPRRTSEKPTDKDAAAAPAGPPPPVMEDWWLVRDAKGDTGWLYGRMMDVDAPDAIARYSEGQRIVGAYVLATVNDPEAPMDDKNVVEYVTVLSPYKAGLPYDFDQVRVFIWNIRKHRYETAFRERNIEGYLPVSVKMAKDPYAKPPASMVEAPTFSFRVLSADAGPVIPDPVTGLFVPGKTNLKTFRLEGNLVRRLVDPSSPPPDDAHPEPVEKKVKAKRAAAVPKRRKK